MGSQIEKQGLLTELDTTVMKATMIALKIMAESSDLSIGEVIDRLILKMCPLDAHLAVTLALERIKITFSVLSDEERSKALKELVTSIAELNPRTGSIH